MKTGTKLFIAFLVICSITIGVFTGLCFINKVNPFTSYYNALKGNKDNYINNSFSFFTGNRVKVNDHEMGNNEIIIQNIDKINEKNYDYTIKSTPVIKNYAKINGNDVEVKLYDAYEYNIKTNIPINDTYSKYYRSIQSYNVYGGFILTLKFLDLYNLEDSYNIYKQATDDINFDDFKNYHIRYIKNSDYTSLIDFSDSNICLYKIVDDEYELVKTITISDRIDLIDNGNIIEIYDDFYSLFNYYGDYFVSLKISQAVYSNDDVNNVVFLPNYNNFFLELNKSEYDHNLLLPTSRNVTHYTQISLLNSKEDCFTYSESDKLDFNNESVLKFGISANGVVFSNNVKFKFSFYNELTNEYIDIVIKNNFLNVVEDYFRGLIEIETKDLISGRYKIIIEGNYSDGVDVANMYDEYEYYFLFNNSEVTE